MATPDAQLQAMRNLHEGWDGYGAAPPLAHVIELARGFVELIEALRRRGAIPDCVIHVTPSRVGGVLIEWEDDAFEHEVEINPDQSFEFLHRNKTTGQMQTRKLAPGPHAVVHPGLLQELSQLLAA
jgi:hypothetical protein